MLTNTTNVIAAGAVFSPVLLSSVDNPILTTFQVLGIIWLAVQIVRAIYFWKK